MGENCIVEHAASLFPSLDQRSERAICTFYQPNWKTRIVDNTLRKAAQVLGTRAQGGKTLR